ncbi:MAG: DNA recombination protein RmuC [Microthrixaceae bacterium]|nr:DNA recombination protein RmuC [Microthrixaceae bacterium]
MDIVLLCVGLLAGLVPGLWFGIRATRTLDSERESHRLTAAQASATEADLRVELAQAQASASNDAQMIDAFRSLSSQVLADQSRQLLQLAESKYGALVSSTDMVLGTHTQAVDAGLKNLESKLESIEAQRVASAAQLGTMVDQLTVATGQTRAEAAKLASALSDNRVRGTWGEVQLRRVLELAGLTRHVDFNEQRTVNAGDSTGRPDVVIPLPSGHCVVIDSKVPLDSYLQAVDATDTSARESFQLQHSKAVGAHVKALSSRDYARMVDGSVDLVLMFLPGEPFLSAALDADPSLFETAADRGVYLVTPSSLVPLLRGIALGWRERQSEQAAAEIHQLGVELHDRIAVFAEHYAKIGLNLDRTVRAFNDSVGSLDKRVLSTARKLSEHGAGSSRTVPELSDVESSARRVPITTADPNAAELSVSADGEEVSDHVQTAIGQD